MSNGCRPSGRGVWRCGRGHGGGGRGVNVHADARASMRGTAARCKPVVVRDAGGVMAVARVFGPVATARGREIIVAAFVACRALVAVTPPPPDRDVSLPPPHRGEVQRRA